MLRSNAFLLLSVVLLLSGCGSGGDLSEEDLDKMAGGKRNETVAVSGVVSVGGAPAAGVVIYAYANQADMDPAFRVRTGADGTYCWSTYKACDGLQPGSYTLAFAHIPKEGKGSKPGEDLLKGRYRDQKKSEFSLKVVSGAPQIDVNYDLK